MPSGNAVVELTEVESGMYDGFTPEEGRYILQTAAAAPMLSADDMVGDWAVARGTGKPICVLTLANSPAGTACWRSRSSPAAIRSSRALRRPPGAWTKARWSCSRRAARPGSSSRTTPIPGSACRKPPIRSCWCGSSGPNPQSTDKRNEQAASGRHRRRRTGRRRARGRTRPARNFLRAGRAPRSSRSAFPRART